MRKRIFNQHVSYICAENGITKKELFNKNRQARIVKARFSLYSICYKTMRVVEIVKLMEYNGYDTNRSSIEYGLQKLNVC